MLLLLIFSEQGLLVQPRPVEAKANGQLDILLKRLREWEPQIL